MIQYVRSRVLPLKSVQLLLRTGMKWQQDDCSGMAAALSYYALFSLFPLLLVVLSLVGSLLGPNTEAFQQIREAVERGLPTQVQSMVRETIVALNRSSTGAGIIGFGLLIYSASTVFGVLSISVDKIWQTLNETTKPQSLPRTVLSYVFNKLLAFLLVMGTAGFLLVSMISNIVIKAVLEILATFQATLPFVKIDQLLLANSLQSASSFIIFALVACVLFKILPSTRVTWRDTLPGGVLSSLLLMGLQQLVSNSVISIGSRYTSYGVIGGVMILMVWIYLTFQIFFIGCEFSYVYAYLFGSRSRYKLKGSR
jgi:membrane protein